MAIEFLGISYLIWGPICLLIAAIFGVFWPHAKGTTFTLRYLILR
jgi:hypothetical protein